MKNKVVSIILILMGGVVCLFHLGGKVKNMIFIAGAEKTTGYVTNVESWTRNSGNSSRNRSMTRNHVLTVTYNVDDVEYTTTFYSGEEVVSQGKPVTVYYKKANPGKAVTEVQQEMNIPYMYPLMLGLGILFLFTGKSKGKK